MDNPKYACLKGEPTLEEILAEPIVLLVLKRNGMTVHDLRRVVTEAAQRLRGSRPVCPIPPEQAVGTPLLNAPI